MSHSLSPLAIAIGNEKLGAKCFVFSRPVGDSCPTSCHFLGNGCYAEATEARFPVARAAGFKNFEISESSRIRALLITATEKGFAIRIHERGDFAKDNRLDVGYVNAWRDAFRSLKRDGRPLPTVWAYTHLHDARLVKALDEFVSIYASVHSEKEMERAKRKGFTLFAWADTSQRFSKPKRRGGSPEVDRFVEIAGDRFVVCPEQRLGRDRVTCTGSKETTACKLCTSGKANVGFIAH